MNIPAHLIQEANSYARLPGNEDLEPVSLFDHPHVIKAKIKAIALRNLDAGDWWFSLHGFLGEIDRYDPVP